MGIWPGTPRLKNKWKSRIHLVCKNWKIIHIQAEIKGKGHKIERDQELSGKKALNENKSLL